MPQQKCRQFLKHGTLPQMAVFEAIVRLGSFTRAAQEMHLAQPTVSGLVRKLSDSAGVPLFEKVGRRVVPTEAGRRLYATAGELFDTLERAGVELAALRSGQPRTEPE
jgi:DNA-binding transcriptional LysR family regulator